MDEKQFDLALNTLVDVAKRDKNMREIKVLHIDNENIKNTCGSCVFWMTYKCPLENKGVKVSIGREKCDNHVIDLISQNKIEDNNRKIALLNNG